MELLIISPYSHCYIHVSLFWSQSLFPQEHFPVKVWVRVRRAHGAQLLRESQGSWFIPTLCQTEGTYLKSGQKYTTMGILLFFPYVAVWDVNCSIK